jgi:methionine aminopeptidase
MVDYEVSDPIDQFNNSVLNKYKTTGKIISKILSELINKCKVDANTEDICKYGNNRMIEECNKYYNEIKYKGICFPTTISVNNYVGNNISNNVLKTNDMLNIELGVHIDGYPAIIAYTLIIGTPTDEQQNVLNAVSEASKQVLKNMKPSNTNIKISSIIQETAKKYGLTVPLPNLSSNNETSHIPGTISYQVSRNVIDGYNDDDDEYVHRLIIHSQGSINDMYELALENNEIYIMDIVMMSGNGKVHIEDNTYGLYKRVYKEKKQLKMKTSRSTLQQFNSCFPINVTNIADNKFKLGLKECISNGLIESYPPVYTKEGAIVGRAKFTVLVRKDPLLIIGRSLDH